MASEAKNDIAVRPATRDDIDFVARVLLFANLEQHEKREGWNEAAFLEGARAGTDDEVQGKVKDSTTYVVLFQGERVGRLRVVRTGEQLEIAGIQLLPEYQNRGIGSAVIESLIQEGKTQNVPVVLEVGKDNPNAKRLYLRLGFEQLSENHDRFLMGIRD